MASTHLPERPKGSILADRSHERWGVLDNHTPRTPHWLIVSAARDNSDDDVDQSSTEPRNLPFVILRDRVLSRGMRRVCGYLEDVVQSASLQERLEVKKRIRGRAFVRMGVGAASGASTHTGT